MLKQDRTEFTEGFTKVFRVVPNGAAYYDDLCDKYGGENVFRASSSTVEDKAFRDAIAACMTGRNDLILAYPGTYTFAAVVTVNKSCTIRPANGNPTSVVIDLTTSDPVAFAITNVDVEIAKFKFNCPDSGTEVTITSTSANTRILGNTFIGNDLYPVRTVYCTGDDALVEGNKFCDCNRAVAVDGPRSIVRKNYIESNHVTAIGVEVIGSAAGKAINSEVVENVLSLSGGTGDIGVKVTNASALFVLIKNNEFGASCSNPISSQADSVICGNYAAGTTATVFITT